MNDEIKLFAECAPGSEDLTLTEENIEETMGDRTIKKITQHVLSPALIPYIPENPDGRCIMIIPGGGYRRLVINKEGSEIARWLNSRGITAFVLKHRMPKDGHRNGNSVPLQDAQRGIRMIRSLSETYGYRNDAVGVMGFSAGAHVAATLGTCFDKKVYEPADTLDSISARPDFLALIYPAVSLRSYGDDNEKMPVHAREHNTILQEYPADELITPGTPPAFIAMADDDTTTPAENSINFYLNLRKSGVPGELHIFRRGSHGFGMGTGRGPVSLWTDLFEKWLDDLETAT